MKNMLENFNIEILEEIERLDAQYITRLDSGVYLRVLGDIAIGSDGRIYYHIGQIRKDEMYTLGWSDEIDEAVIFDDGGSGHFSEFQSGIWRFIDGKYVQITKEEMIEEEKQTGLYNLLSEDARYK